MILGVYGFHKSGKTTFLEKLMAELRGRGVSASVIKHLGGHYESGGKKDTDRLTAAGFSPVIGIAEDETLVSMKGGINLQDALDMLQGAGHADVIFVEGFKHEKLEKIAVGDIKRLPGTIFRAEQFDEIVRYIEKKVKKERDSMKKNSCCEEIDLTCKGGEKVPKLKVKIVVNGKKLTANPFVQKIFWETTCGMVKSLRGVDKEIESLEISLSKE